jgi:electron transfer flavoprotein alpha subunit
VAVNNDADAPIFRNAKFGIIGDCREILSALNTVAKELCRR